MFVVLSSRVVYFLFRVSVVSLVGFFDLIFKVVFEVRRAFVG